MGKLVVESGKVFGKVTVVSEQIPSSKKVRCFIVKCSCGSDPFVTRLENLTKGNTKSCGCSKKLSNVKHGKSKTNLYSVWSQMHQRCYNPRNKSFANYGGRGISVCLEWQDFENFDSWAKDIYSPDLQIERIDNNGNYSPLNCKFTGRSEQGYNKRIPVTNKSGKVGVHWHKTTNKWLVKIGREYVGIFELYDDAVKIRVIAEIAKYGKELGH